MVQGGVSAPRGGRSFRGEAAARGVTDRHPQCPCWWHLPLECSLLCLQAVLFHNLSCYSSEILLPASRLSCLVSSRPVTFANSDKLGGVRGHLLDSIFTRCLDMHIVLTDQGCPESAQPRPVKSRGRNGWVFSRQPWRSNNKALGILNVLSTIHLRKRVCIHRDCVQGELEIVMS